MSGKRWLAPLSVVPLCGLLVFTWAMAPASDLKVAGGHYDTDFGHVPMCLLLYDPPLELWSTALVSAALVAAFSALLWPRRPERVPTEDEPALPRPSRWRTAVDWLRRGAPVLLGSVACLGLVNRWKIEQRLARELVECESEQAAAFKRVDALRAHYGRKGPPPAASNRPARGVCTCPPGDPLCSCL
jgi:hypothetical protein